MALYQFHYVLIIASILFDAGFTWFCIRRWQLQGDSMDIVMAVGSTIIGIAFIIYLLAFRKKVRRMTGEFAAAGQASGSESSVEA